MSSYESSSYAVSLTSSPPLRRRLSDASSREELINAFEAEEERIINVLSRKLEQLQRDKVTLERVHEEESEATVNRLTRELEALKRRIRSQEDLGEPSLSSSSSSNGISSAPSSSGLSIPIESPSSSSHASADPNPSSTVLLAALRKENEELRARVVVAEREYGRVRRLNEVYREELIEHRRRLGLSVDNLIGLESSTTDPLSQPLHLRSSSNASSSSPTASMVALSSAHPPRVSTTHSMPIPRHPAQRATHKPPPSIPQTPLSTSPPSSAESPSPYPFSPVLTSASMMGHHHHHRYQYHPSSSSYVSTQTTLTTPNSIASLQAHPPAPYGQDANGTNGVRTNGPSLTYPSVPPPSLSSSLGSPTISYYIGTREPPSPVDEYSLSRRSSMSHTGGSGTNGTSGGGARRVVETGNLRDLPRSRRTSVERGGRIAETGSLVPVRGGTTTTGNVSDSPVLGAFVPSLNETIE